MAKLSGAQIKDLALKEIAKHPEGIGPSGLLKIIQARHPETADGTIRGAVWKLDRDFPDLVMKGNGRYIMVHPGRALPSKNAAPKGKAKPKGAAKGKTIPDPPKMYATDQESEMRALREKIAKVQKTVCGT